MSLRKSYSTHQFPNGFRLMWKETDSFSVFGNLRIDHGALHERPGEEGTAHFLEHMLVEGGTKEYTPEEQRRIRNKFGYSNAFTTGSRTMIPFGMNDSDLTTYLDIVSQMAFYPRLDSKIISQQKEIVKREIARKKGSPDFRDFREFFWPNLTRDRDHTYLVLGREEVIDDLTEEKLREFHQRGYSPNNAVLMLAGNLPSDIVGIVERYFGDLPRGSGKPFEFSPVSRLTSQTIRYSKAEDLLNKDRPTESNAHLTLGFVLPDEFHEDGENFHIATEILGKGETLGLRKRIRTERGISYDIGCSYNGKDKLGSVTIKGKVHASRREEAIDLIFEEVDKLHKTKIDEREIEDAKKRLVHRTTTRVEGFFEKLVLFDPINVSAISNMDESLNGRVPLEERLARIEAATPESIQRVANEHFPSDRKKDNYVLLVRDPLLKS